MDSFHVWLRRTLWGLSLQIEAAFETPLGPNVEHRSQRRRADRRRGPLRRRPGGVEAELRGRDCAGFLTVPPGAAGPRPAGDRLRQQVARRLGDAGLGADPGQGSWWTARGRSRPSGWRERAPLQSAALASSIWIVCRKRPAARAGWDSAVLAEMRANITQQLRDFWVAGIRGPDFVWAATGPALEAFSRYPVVKRADEPGQRMTVSAFLREVRRFVVDFVVGRVLTHDGGAAAISGLDGVITYYLLHRNDFGTGGQTAT